MNKYSQYLDWLDDNPGKNLTFDEWNFQITNPSLNVESSLGITEQYEDSDEHLSDWDVTLHDCLELDLPINMKSTLSKIAEIIKTVEYSTGDISDIGNEIGWALGQIFPSMNDEDVSVFMIGFKHGVSLTNGTHFVGDSWDLNIIKEDENGVLVSSSVGDTQWMSLTEWETYKINKNKNDRIN